MLYILSQDELINLDPVFYWMEGEQAVTSSYFIDNAEQYTDLLAPTELKLAVASAEINEQYCIYDLYSGVVNDPYALPKYIIFPEQLNQNLYKDVVLYYGDKIRTTFFRDYNPLTEELSQPIVKIEFNFVRGANHYAKCVERTFYWMKKSGEWGTETYSDIKVFATLREKLGELRVVRENILNEAQEMAIDLGLSAQMAGLYESYIDQIARYESVGSAAFSQAIANDPGEWLEAMTPDNAMTIRTFLTNFFLIGAIENG